LYYGVNNQKSMKKIILLMLVIIPLHSFSQEAQPAVQVPVDQDTHKIMYREVVSQEGVKDILYNRAAEWLRSYYVNPTSVVKVLDKVNGKIEGTGRMNIFYTDKDGTSRNAGMILYNLNLEFKDNKYRYTLFDFNLKSESRSPLEKWLNKSDPAYNEQWDVYLYQVDTTMQRLIKSLKAGMQPKVVKKDEW
jgi:hypothetical protein